MKNLTGLAFVIWCALFYVAKSSAQVPLLNGVKHHGFITTNNTQDLWVFSAEIGDTIILRMGTTNSVSMDPLFYVYYPNGVVITNGNPSADAEYSFTATNQGAYLVVATHWWSSPPVTTGGYTLSMAKIPGDFFVSLGDEGGELTNGGVGLGTIDRGDLDMWRFTADAGDSFVLRAGSTNGGWNPFLRLYDPMGVLVDSASGIVDSGAVAGRATNSGVFTVVVGSWFRGDSGNYKLHLAQIPGGFVVPSGDEGGSLTNGVSQDGYIERGDLDMWRFGACRSNTISLQCQTTSATVLTPRIILFGPSGQALRTNSNATLAQINHVALETGIYTVVVQGGGDGANGTYRITGNGLSDESNLCIPFFSQPNISGTNLTLSVVGGIANTPFVLLASTNVVLPVSQWTPILTNQLNQSGVFNYTNFYDPLIRQRFFLLRQN